MLLICVASYGYWPKSTYDLQSSHWHFETRWTIEMSMGAYRVAMECEHLIYIFGEFIYITSGVNVAQLCTAAIDQHSG